MQKFKFIGGTEKTLDTMSFLEMDYGTVYYLQGLSNELILRNVQTEGGTGHIGFICHKQPTLEKHLRDIMTSSEYCQLRFNCTVSEISEDNNYTYSRYQDVNGTTHTIKSRFFIGADGKTGFTRKNYLEPLGIHMEQAHQYSPLYYLPCTMSNLTYFIITPKTLFLGSISYGIFGVWIYGFDWMPIGLGNRADYDPRDPAS